MTYPGLPSTESANYFPDVDDKLTAADVVESKSLEAQEYVEIIADAIKLRKNVCLGRNFNQASGSFCTVVVVLNL